MSFARLDGRFLAARELVHRNIGAPPLSAL
jgi:hypothetical protein